LSSSATEPSTLLQEASNDGSLRVGRTVVRTDSPEAVEMTQETTFETCGGIVVPAPVLLQRQPKNPYGSVEGLSDEELADPAELER
jgi:hypothetical protein